MLKGIIDFSLKNKFIVLLGTIVLVVGGLYALKNVGHGRLSMSKKHKQLDRLVTETGVGIKGPIN